MSHVRESSVLVDDDGATGEPGHRAAHRGIGLVAALGIGLVIAAQSRVNGELGHRLGDGIAAAVVSFGGGLVVLLVLVPASPWGRRGLTRLRAALRDRSLRPWQCLGGVCGAFFVVGQGLTVATLGVALFTVAVVAGQAASGLAVDRAGLGPAGPQPLTLPRVLGAGLAVVAVVIAVSGRLGDPAGWALALLPALAGAGLAWQQAVNGRVRGAAGAALPAAFVNFLTGTAALLLVLVVDLAVRGLPDAAPADWWLYAGGPLGIVFIAGAAAVVRITGVLVLGLGSVAGQLVGAVLLDVFVPAPGQSVDTATFVGTGLTLVAIVLAVLPGRVSRVSS
ncbi:transporter family-2 protein [Streptoalloteichus tenebrarius]|uniref:Transporter family-2 protein n=1 Tax=Streptoalloteichus tenebrarius (strain ATCC 17920 / DSM 40477 / JCM 4838 / CBS 697.72 / NBRC 16177 / NCIMB 11028 / NRRL B-12390 / A12253. 1 / ISP 5477) TaxID=1933 RepID=A0ABT1I1D5_STRSD|nr:DMT family transporter [Streptoalloteichus tenebrarius]MCP2261548.1 transporter family-2 protein [Streptoalloteichus tenebrarius]BFF02677.1 DMT family transporter [Streptoalloteichus tenebrarius]